MDIPLFQSRGQQTLAAIAFSDIVGFSARMGKDEIHILSLVERDFKFMTELCQKFTGKVLKTTDDGLLMYFVSAVQAVDCTREMQTEFAKSANILPKNIATKSPKSSPQLTQLSVLVRFGLLLFLMRVRSQFFEDAIAFLWLLRSQFFGNAIAVFE